MAAPLIDWGYTRRKYTRKNYYDPDDGQWKYSTWIYEQRNRVIQPSSFYIGGHDRSGSGHGVSQTQYTDFPYLIFTLPAEISGASLRLKLTVPTAHRFYLRRITKEIEEDDKTITTTTSGQISRTPSASGWLTYSGASFEGLLQDLEDNGNYGLCLFTDTPTSSMNTKLANVETGIEFSWGGATVPTYSSDTVALGTSVSITTINTNPDVEHTLTASFEGQTELIGDELAYDAVTSWTPSINWASLIPSAESGTCYITCDTYLDGELLGSTQTSIILTVPSSVKCVVSSVSLTEYVAGIDSQFHAFVQGKSRLSVATSTSGSGAYGASVTAYSVSINGGVLSGGNIVTSTLKTSGTNSYSVTITDTRGRTDTYNGTFSVLAYAQPFIKITSAERDSVTPSTVNIAYEWSISAVSNLNTKKIILSDGTEITPATYSGTATAAITGTDPSDTEEVYVEILDFFTDPLAPISYSYFVPPAGTVDIDVGQDGSMGFGMDAQDNGEIDVALPTVFHAGARGLFTLLWTNPSPTSNFAAQTVSINLSKYTFVMVEVMVYTTTDRRGCYIFTKDNVGVANIKGANASTFSSRLITPRDTGVEFGGGYSGTTANNGYCIPTHIWAF